MRSCCLTSANPVPIILEPLHLLEQLAHEYELMATLFEAVITDNPDAAYLIKREGNRPKVILEAIKATLEKHGSKAS